MSSDEIESNYYMTVHCIDHYHLLNPCDVIIKSHDATPTFEAPEKRVCHRLVHSCCPQKLHLPLQIWLSPCLDGISTSGDWKSKGREREEGGKREGRERKERGKREGREREGEEGGGRRGREEGGKREGRGREGRKDKEER